MSEDKKIIIDSDWKDEVKKDKAKLEEQETTQTEDMGDEMPEASFEILVNLLATQAAYGLGLIPSENGDPVINFPVSKLNIDLLGILEEKGLVFSGHAPEYNIMQILEIPDHPFFLGTQSHPCLTSRPLDPSPMFLGLVAAAMKHKFPGIYSEDLVTLVKKATPRK